MNLPIISGPDNYLETRSAVTGHTEMAIKMLRDGQGVSNSTNLQNDIGAYMMGQKAYILFSFIKLSSIQIC